MNDFHLDLGKPWAQDRKGLVFLVGGSNLGKELETTIKVWFDWGSLPSALSIEYLSWGMY